MTQKIAWPSPRDISAGDLITGNLCGVPFSNVRVKQNDDGQLFIGHDVILSNGDPNRFVPIIAVYECVVNNWWGDLPDEALIEYDYRNSRIVGWAGNFKRLANPGELNPKRVYAISSDNVERFRKLVSDFRDPDQAHPESIAQCIAFAAEDFLGELDAK